MAQTTIYVEKVGYDWIVRRGPTFVGRFQSRETALLEAKELETALRMTNHDVEVRIGPG